MSLNISGEKCSVCHSYLFDDDDIVYCPECGAPHHRECYNSVGHCGVEQYHGTDKQYQRPQPETQRDDAQQETIKNDNETVCRICGNSYDANSRACPNCNAPNISKTGVRFIEVDLLGGVPAEMDLGDGVTANDAKAFVGYNTQRYIRKFAGFKVGKKASWNWAAFLFPSAWFAFRKMYAKSAVIGTIQVALSMLLLPLNHAISFLDISSARNYAETFKIIMQNIDKIGIAAIVTAVIASILGFIIRVVCAIISDYSYKKHVILAVREIKQDTETQENNYRKRGGISITAALIAIMAVQYLPVIFASLIGIL